MKLRLFASHYRRNSVGDKVIVKKWIYLETNTLQRKNVGHLRRQEALKYGMVSFYGVGNEWEDYFNYFGEGSGISRDWATAPFWSLKVVLRTVIVPGRVS